jgi:cytidyltransferase-like protein
MKVVLITGGFDPAHSGHVAYINAAKALGDKLVVGINSDAWLERKKGRAFMPWAERAAIISALKNVDSVIDFDDADGSAVHAINQVVSDYSNCEIIFANGGDRTNTNIPEMGQCVNPNLKFVFGIGGDDKKNSSSWILNEWKSPKTERPWGYYRVLHDISGTKVKELTVNPGSSLSMQRHKLRAEHWIVSEGQCVVNSKLENGYVLPATSLVKHQSFDIRPGEWHQLTNPYSEPCKVVEIQYGELCVEEDIERQL